MKNLIIKGILYLAMAILTTLVSVVIFSEMVIGMKVIASSVLIYMVILIFVHLDMFDEL